LGGIFAILSQCGPTFFPCGVDQFPVGLVDDKYVFGFILFPEIFFLAEVDSEDNDLGADSLHIFMVVVRLFPWFDVLLAGFNEFPFFEEPLKSRKDLGFFLLKLFGFFAAVGILNIKGSVALDDGRDWMFNLHGLFLIIADLNRLFLLLFHVLYY
jgi:hypothetical protein